ncbi:histidine phosphatase family protein [Thalassotalea fusca]
MAKIHLVRHTKVMGPAALYGHNDIAVAPKDNQALMVQLLAQNISPTKVLTSPLQRCQSLATALAIELDCPLAIEPAFTEMDFGDYDGVPFDDIVQRDEKWQVLERFWQNPVQNTLPNAELLAGFSYRVLQGWRKLLAAELDGELVIICHGGVIRMILAHLLGVDWRNANLYTRLNIAYGSMTTLNISERRDVTVECIARPILPTEAVV